MVLKIPIFLAFLPQKAVLFLLKLPRKLFSDFLLLLPVEIRISFEEIVERGNFLL